MHEAMIVFGNNKNICDKITKRIFKSGAVVVFKLATSTCSVAEMQEISESVMGKKLVLVFRNNELKNITEAFHSLGVNNIYICPWDTHYSDEKPLTDLIIPIDNSKPRLDYLEIEISNICNLNCKGCSEFSNLICEENQVDYNSFRNDLEKLNDFFWGIGKIRLLGGEPLTNKDYLSFVKTARESYPDCDLRLVTNGLLIPAINKADLAEIKRNNCTFDISNYPPTRKIIKSIKNLLGQSGVSYNIGMPVKYFFKLFLPEPLESPDESYINCLFTHCHSLGGGYLSACSHQFWVHRLNTAFDLHYPIDEKIDIYNTPLSGWEINEIFNNPLDFCRYCPKGMVPYKWKHRSNCDAEANDWIIKNTYINRKVIPVIQRTAIKFAKQLRLINQQPKGNRK
ncbi:MAG: radical SAM protein [Eubacteriales bacterium]